MTMKFKCHAYTDYVSKHGKITPVCKVLNSPCAVGHCKLFKTYAQYNHKKVEAEIEEYGRTHE